MNFARFCGDRPQSCFSEFMVFYVSFGLSSIAITSLGEGAGHCADYLLVCLWVACCPMSLPFDVRGWLRLALLVLAVRIYTLVHLLC